MIEELKHISAEMNAILPLFLEGNSVTGLFLPTGPSAKFKALAIEAKSILDEELGRLNNYSTGLMNAASSGSQSFIGGPSYATVEEASELVLAGARAVSRKYNRATVSDNPKNSHSYVHQDRISALIAINESAWDFRRLVELCRELNVVAANRCHLSTAMLLRTILNHVPPVLGCETFDQVANNYGGPKKDKSFKEIMQRLQGTIRKIADMHLHSPIRNREDVPTAIQVDFASELDVLLGEVIRVGGSGKETK